MNLDDSIYNGEMYTMVESEVYFEPYYHIMKALQDPSFPQHLAMQQYIVKVDVSTYPFFYSLPAKRLACSFVLVDF